nr:MAG TPA: Baseplate structural protein [Caudoviricetes sp.]
MIYEKPKNEIFASDAKDGEIVDFPNIKRGWGVTENLGFIPPMEYFNAAFNRIDKSMAYQLQRGVGEWDKDLEYPIGAVVSLNRGIYIAKSQNTNRNPASEATIWNIVATQKWCEDSFMKKTDVTDATETKAGITKLKNAITAKQEDAAVTEKAVAEVIEANKSIGVDQTWQDVSAQRQAGVTYTNTTGRPIQLNIGFLRSGDWWAYFVINGINIKPSAGGYSPIIPPNNTYKLIIKGMNNLVWLELR